VCEVEEAPCVVCRKPMPAGAMKCTECESYQDARRFIFSWSGVVTALLALVPIWSGALSLYKLAGEKKPDVHVEFMACRADELLVAVSNVGELPAVLGQVAVDIEADKKWVKLPVRPIADSQQLISDTGKSHIISLTTPSGRVFGEGEVCQVRLKFPIYGGSENSETNQAKCTCGL